MTKAGDHDAKPLPMRGQGLSALAPSYDLIFCDVWGVVHNGAVPFLAASDALQRFRNGGGTVVLITNAPAPAPNVIRRMQSIGVPDEFFDAISTSGDVTAALIAEAGCPPVYHIGPKHELDIYHEAARLGPRAPELAGIDQADLAIVIGPVRPLESYDPELAILKARGLPMICANPDIVVQVGDALEYCAGAIAERYERMGGTVIQAGKPFPAIYDRALSLVAGRTGPVAKSRILAIGDAVHTDMQGASRLGIDALLITSGIHRAELHGLAPDAPLDEAALGQFLDGQALHPRAVMSGLHW